MSFEVRLYVKEKSVDLFFLLGILGQQFKQFVLLDCELMKSFSLLKSEIFQKIIQEKSFKITYGEVEKLTYTKNVSKNIQFWETISCSKAKCCTLRIFLKCINVIHIFKAGFHNRLTYYKEFFKIIQFLGDQLYFLMKTFPQHYKSLLKLVARFLMI